MAWAMLRTRIGKWPWPWRDKQCIPEIASAKPEKSIYEFSMIILRMMGNQEKWIHWTQQTTTSPLQEKIAVVARLRPTKPSSNVGGTAEYMPVGGQLPVTLNQSCWRMGRLFLKIMMLNNRRNQFRVFLGHIHTISINSNPEDWGCIPMERCFIVDTGIRFRF